MNSANVPSTYRKISLIATLFTGLSLLAPQRVESMGLLTAVTIPRAGIWMHEEPPASQPAKEKSRDITKGYWHSRETRDKYCVRFGENDEFKSWGMTECFDKTAFEKKQNDVFLLKRETGTLTLTGKLDQEEGDGEYEFIEDSAFKKYLTDQNINSRDENFMFHLYLADVKKDYIQYLINQYSQIDGDRLLELAIHGISHKNYQSYIALFEKYSGKKPSMQEVVEARIHGIDQAYVEELRVNGFTNLSMKKMMEAKIHGVDGAFINEMKQAGFSNLTIQEIISAKIHGVDPAYIRQMEKLGFTNLGLDKLSEAKIHGITAAYVQDLEKAGFSKLSLSKLIEAKIHGVNADFIDEAKRKGYNLDSIGEYISLKIHGMAKNIDKD